MPLETTIKETVHLATDFPELSLEEIIYYIRNEGFYIIPLQYTNFPTYILVCEYQSEWQDYYTDTYADELEEGRIGEPIMVNADNFHELRTRFEIYKK
jgi:hypothetical protein